MKRARLLSAALAVAALAAAHAARADDRGHVRVPMLPAYVQECGACHAPFPARTLSAPSWNRITARLATHYGVDASLDAATRDAIAAWLASNAGAGRRVDPSPAEDRITRSAWFVHKHREVPGAAWKRAAVGRPSNCGACHPRADQGGFDEHEARIPR